MAVRFLPASEEQREPAPQRENLAEVIELRSMLRPASELVAEPGPRQPRVSRLPPASRRVAAPASADAATQPAETEARDAQQDATRLLARKAQSSGELRSALLVLGHGPTEVDQVIAEFEQNLYLDDTGFARALTEKLRQAKRASRSQIRVKMRERKLPDSVIERVLAELGDDEEFELLHAAAEERARRLQGLDRATAERRLLGFLARRGWSGEPAYRATREALDAMHTM